MKETNIKPEAQTLMNLVEYQDGSIVSRTILNKSMGNVTLFAFDAGESLSEHTSSHDALAISIEGGIEISIGNDVHQLATGDILPMPAQVPHALRAIERCKLLLILMHD